MSTVRLLGLVCVLVAGAALAAPAAAQDERGQIVAPVQVALSRSEVSTRLGESFGFRSRITNTGAQPLSGLVAHLNVVGLSSGIYVDPEDWSEERTRSVAPLGPGESADVAWDVTAVTGGEAAIYVVVLPGSSPATARTGLAVSPAMDVSIAEAKNLNSGGVLPLALGVPALLGLATIVVRRRRGRSTPAA